MKSENGGGNIVKRRPAETAGIASALAVLVAKLLGVDDSDVIVALAVVIGFIPAAITFVVELTRR
jgi:hypothetical protein